jgi:hypothetical protein
MNSTEPDGHRVSRCKSFGDDTYGDFSAVALFPVRVAEAQTDQRMDHLDKLGYAFLGFCVAVFLPCIIAIYRSKQEQFL